MRALVADDHSVIRLALRHILADVDTAVEIREAADAREAMDALATGPVDLVITDIFMPGADADFVHRLTQAAAPAPVVVFSVSENPQHAQAAITAGARGFIPKTTGEALIVNILRLILAGGIYLPPAMTLAAAPGGPAAAGGDGERGAGARRALGLPGEGPLSQVDLMSRRPQDQGHGQGYGQGQGHGQGQPGAGHLPQLTPRQLEVLELLAQGLSNADIGLRLGLNLSTVKSHVTGVLRALKVSSRTQAVLAFKQADWPSSL